MEIELYPILSTIILASTVITIVFSLFSYVLFRIRENKAAKRRMQSSAGSAAEAAPIPASMPPAAPAPPVQAERPAAAFAAAAASESSSTRHAQSVDAAPVTPISKSRFFRPYKPAA